MMTAIMEEIETYSKRIYGITGPDRLFRFTKGLIGGQINRGSIKAGILHLRIHDMTHSHVSLLSDMGFTPHLIAERIGDTVQMLSNIYGHLYPNKHNEVADKLDQLIVSK